MCLKKIFFNRRWYFVTIFFLGVGYISNVFAAELLSIDFFQEGEAAKVEFSFDEKNVKCNKFHLAEDKQIILDFTNVNAKKRVLRSFDTSEFSGSVVMVSPYKRPESEDDLRVAVQLRDNVRATLERKDNKVILNIENRFGAFNKPTIEAAKREEPKIVKGEGDKSKLNIPKSDSVADILDNLTLSGPKKYVGKKISINVKNMSVVALLNMIANSSGFNMILDEDVAKAPSYTLALTNIPWDQALDIVLSLGKLVAQKTGNILTITTLAKATEEKKQEVATKELYAKQEPLVTRIFPISFADIKELSELLKQYLTKERGAISQETRTNSIIVKDTMEVIDRMKKIIETLDTQTPQILIEAKIVEATESFAMNLGLKSGGLRFGYDPISRGDRLGRGTDGLTGNLANQPNADLMPQLGPGFMFSTVPSEGDGGTDFMSFGIRALGRMSLNFSLQLMESESKGKIISSPKVITQNKKLAEITSTEQTSYTVTTGVGDTAQRSFQTISTNLKLSVTPHVTNDGSIAMDIALDKGSFSKGPNEGGPPDITTRNVKTNVLVDNGSTIVIGGIYTFTKNENSQGIPFLKDIPILGWLFKSQYNPSKSKNELIIFLTPRVINQEEAGLTEKDDSLG
ncbi:MAG: type IV pilus secretin PilQ [Oligoflexia bacterium]|nr:type IV pilus secretin PilQ [Oligoflexia bacterium]